MVFTTLNHLIDRDLLDLAYQRTRKDGAVGIDGKTAGEYGAGLSENLATLLERFKSGRYVAPSVRRVWIPKGDGTKTRPIGIPTFEDKVLQRAVLMVLEAIYEQDFRACSYGFRPGRSAHQALHALRDGLMEMGGGWVVEADIVSFFDTLDPSHLRSFLDQRVRDGVLRRTIDKWLKAGVLEEGKLTRPDLGTPQGGVISPLLANIYLHEVLDKWFEDVVRPKMVGRCFLVRYADDFVLVCSDESDARRVFEVLPKRFEKYGLRLHPEKTRLLPFVSPGRRPPPGGSQEQPESFDLLGFTHHWARSRNGWWVIKQKTSKSRLRRTLKRVSEWCQRNRHFELKEQQVKLSQQLTGHYGYFGVTGNSPALSHVYEAALRIWRKWLNRRSQRGRMPWDRFARLLECYPLQKPVAVHSTYRPQRRP
jgi:RNA-directed DNA polymerase